MAERRMISRNVIMDDRFLDLPAKSRALYLCLLVSADDDGFIGGPKSIMRQAGASPKDLALLESGDFLILFSTGTAVIRHWFCQNSIRKDRYIPTQYQQERSRLIVDSNGVYQMATTGCREVADGLPQERIGKDRLGKDRLEEKEEKKEMEASGAEVAPSVPAPTEEETFNHQVLSLYQRHCSGLLPCTGLDTTRRKRLDQLRKQGWTLQTLEKAFIRADGCAFLRGINTRNWRAGFDWLIRHENLVRVNEGAYDDRPESAAVPQGCGQLGASELEAISRVLREEL